MRDFKKERGRGRQYARMLLGLCLMVAVGAVALGTARAAWGMYQKFSDASVANAGIQSELANLKVQYAAVSETVESLSTSRGLEAAVRERYGSAKPGEGEIDIVRQAPAESESAGAEKSFWSRLWQSIFVW